MSLQAARVPDTKQGCARLWEVSCIQRLSQEVTACVVAGIMSGTTAAIRDVLDTLLALRRLSLAEKTRGLGRRAGVTPGCSVVNLVQGGVSTSEHAQALVIF